jgi:hypothetical protein
MEAKFSTLTLTLDSDEIIALYMITHRYVCAFRDATDLGYMDMEFATKVRDLLRKVGVPRIEEMDVQQARDCLYSLSKKKDEIR